MIYIFSFLKSLKSTKKSIYMHKTNHNDSTNFCVTFKIFRTQCGGECMVEVDEGGQNVKIPSYKINN